MSNWGEKTAQKFRCAHSASSFQLHFLEAECAPYLPEFDPPLEAADAGNGFYLRNGFVPEICRHTKISHNDLGPRVARERIDRCAAA